MPMPNFKFSFALPKGQQVALADASGLNILNKYIPEKDISIIDIEHMNAFALMRMLVAGKKSLFDYTIAYIKIFKPRFVFTFLDNNVDFYKLAAIFPNTKFIAIQNGQRANYANQSGFGFFDLLKSESAKNKLSAHAICVLGTTAADQYTQYIQAKPVVTGSLKNNLIGNKIKPTERFDIVYVSQHAPFKIPNSEVNFFFGNKSITAEEFYAIEQKIVRFLAEHSKRTNQSFAVLGKRTDSSPYEREFFSSAASPNTVRFIPRTSETSTYEFCNSASLIVTADSTIGYEFLARGNKVVFLSGRTNAISDELSREIHDTNFGFPLELGSSGPFWTNTASESDFEQLIRSVQSMSDAQWATAISPYNDLLMAYQPGNTGFIRLLQNEGIPITNEGSQRA
jgi:surface carbohydrate biosynthesis protein